MEKVVLQIIDLSQKTNSVGDTWSSKLPSRARQAFGMLWKDKFFVLLSFCCFVTLLLFPAVSFVSEQFLSSGACASGVGWGGGFCTHVYATRNSKLQLF